MVLEAASAGCCLMQVNPRSKNVRLSRVAFLSPPTCSRCGIFHSIGGLSLAPVPPSQIGSWVSLRCSPTKIFFGSPACCWRWLTFLISLACLQGQRSPSSASPGERDRVYSHLQSSHAAITGNRHTSCDVKINQELGRQVHRTKDLSRRAARPAG